MLLFDERGGFMALRALGGGGGGIHSGLGRNGTIAALDGCGYRDIVTIERELACSHGPTIQGSKIHSITTYSCTLR